MSQSSTSASDSDAVSLSDAEDDFFDPTSLLPQLENFDFTRLPVDIQLLIIEELTYGELKTFERTSKAMRTLVATPTAKLDVTLFREGEVDLQRLKACIGGDPRVYRDLKLHPLLEETWVFDSADPQAGNTEQPCFAPRNDTEPIKYYDLPRTTQENCCSPPANEIHLCYGVPRATIVRIRSEDGGPIKLDLLLCSTSIFIAAVCEPRNTALGWNPEVEFREWRLLAPDPDDEAIVCFCEPGMDYLGT